MDSQHFRKKKVRCNRLFCQQFRTPRPSATHGQLFFRPGSLPHLKKVSREFFSCSASFVQPVNSPGICSATVKTFPPSELQLSPAQSALTGDRSLPSRHSRVHRDRFVRAIDPHSRHFLCGTSPSPEFQIAGLRTSAVST